MVHDSRENQDFSPKTKRRVRVANDQRRVK